MAVVHESIEDGVGERRFIDVGVPLIDGKLTGDERGFLVVTILEDFQQVSLGLIAERRQSEVIDVEQIDFRKLLQEPRAIGLRMMTSEFFRYGTRNVVSERLAQLTAQGIGGEL